VNGLSTPLLLLEQAWKHVQSTYTSFITSRLHGVRVYPLSVTVRCDHTPTGGEVVYLLSVTVRWVHKSPAMGTGRMPAIVAPTL
jgi:hypothetical protein